MTRYVTFYFQITYIYCQKNNLSMLFFVSFCFITLNFERETVQAFYSRIDHISKFIGLNFIRPRKQIYPLTRLDKQVNDK